MKTAIISIESNMSYLVGICIVSSISDGIVSCVHSVSLCIVSDGINHTEHEVL